MSTRAVLVLCATCLLLTACSKGAEQPAGKAAGAQVLPGTVSDAMLNLDQSRAQPLLQPPPRSAATANDSPSDAPSEAPAATEPAQPAAN